MAAPHSIALTDLPPVDLPRPSSEQVSKALTAILRHDAPDQAFTVQGLQARLRMQVTDDQLIHVLQTMRRQGRPRFTGTEHEGATYWRMTIPGRARQQ